MGEKYKDRILIDMGEFQSKILEHVCSEEFNKQFDSTQFSTYEDAKGYRQAMMHGMVMASLMTSKCMHFYVRENLETKNDESEPADVEEIKHGHWYGVNHYQDKASGQCSECKKRGVLRTDRDSFGIWYIDMPRCPNCGAIMDGKINYM